MDPAQTVKKALEIVEILGQYKSLTASQINEITGFHRSTNYRLLGTLLQLGYLRKNDASGLYSLSSKFVGLAARVLENRDIAKDAKPFLEELYDRTGETVHLAILDQNELVYLDKIESKKSLRVVMSSKPGSHAPLHCTGIGKVLLAGMAPLDLKRFIDRLTFSPFTPNTITAAEALKEEIELIKLRGYAEDNEEHEPGVCCIAAPIKNSFQETVAGLSVSLPSVRYTRTAKSELIRAVTRTGVQISEAIS